MKHTEKTVYRVWDKWFKSILEQDNQENKENPLEALCIGICETLFTIKEKFWVELRCLKKEQESEDLKEWLVKLIVHLETKFERMIKRNRKKIKNFEPTKHLNSSWLIKDFLIKDMTGINLSNRHFSKDEVSLPSKRLKFVPTPKDINKVK